MEMEKFLRQGKISKIIETELPRYINFFDNTYKENLEHVKFNLEKFPRWSIISGYYAMHDITKLFLAKNFNIKIEFEVHKTTIKVLKGIIKDKEVLRLLKIGYHEFITIANDLTKAKKERTRAQYYTGTEFAKEKYKEKASDFLDKIVLPYLEKINNLMEK